MSKKNKKPVSKIKIATASLGALAIIGGSYFLAQNTVFAQKCHALGTAPYTLQDHKCTPGSIDPTVTQNNIQKTICVPGYTDKVRPPTSYTNKLKTQQIKQYGYKDKNPQDYEEDHLISLELGGNPTDPKNLWPEPGASPNTKDNIENNCKKMVCSGKIKLKDAQDQIKTNWITACQ